MTWIPTLHRIVTRDAMARQIRQRQREVWRMWQAQAEREAAERRQAVDGARPSAARCELVGARYRADAGETDLT